VVSLKGMVDGVAASRSDREAVDERQFWRLYDASLPSVYGYLLRRTGDQATAEDLTQEVFLTAARTAREGAPDKLTLPWLLTVARSRLIDHVRARQRAERKLELAWRAAAQREDEVVRVPDDESQLGPMTEAALDSLPPVQRAALVLHHLDDMSVAAVAGALGKSTAATESLLARAGHGFRIGFEGARNA
jgi:RNA polymerase sigma-70 factor, ECF subfamily